jgi:hypothetical protein
VSEKGWSTGRIVAMIVASIVALIGVGFALGGAALLAVDGFARDDDGFLTSPREDLESGSFAITAEEIDLTTDPAGWAPRELLGTARVTVSGSSDMFIGIAPADELNAYLQGVAHSELEEIENGEPRYTDAAGGRPPGRPGAEDFWVASSSGPGEQYVDWDAESGVWSVAVMNADGSRNVAVEAKAGVELDWLGWAGLIALILGLLITAAAIILIIVISRGATAHAKAERGQTAPPENPPTP